MTISVVSFGERTNTEHTKEEPPPVIINKNTAHMIPGQYNNMRN